MDDFCGWWGSLVLAAFTTFDHIVAAIAEIGLLGGSSALANQRRMCLWHACCAVAAVHFDVNFDDLRVALYLGRPHNRVLEATVLVMVTSQ